MKKIAALLFILALTLLLGGCEDSMIVKVAVECADLNNNYNNTESIIWDDPEEGAVTTEERIYPGDEGYPGVAEGNVSKQTPIFTTSDLIQADIVDYKILDYVKESGDFIYYYAGKTTGKEFLGAYEYYDEVAIVNPVNETYIPVKGDYEFLITDEASVFQYSEGLNNTYYFKFQEFVYKYQYSASEADSEGNRTGGKVTQNSHSTWKIYGNLSNSYGFTSEQHRTCTDLITLSNDMVLYSAVFYADDSAWDSIDIEIDDDGNLVGDVGDVITEDTYALYQLDFRTDKTLEEEFAGAVNSADGTLSGPYSCLPSGQTLNACSFPKDEILIYTMSSSNSRVYALAYKNRILGIGGEPDKDIGVGAYTGLNGDKYIAMFRENETLIYKIGYTIDLSGMLTEAEMTYVCTIPAYLYSTITKHQILILDDNNIYAAAINGLYSREGKIRNGCYYALFQYDSDQIIAVGFDNTIYQRIYTYPATTLESGEVVADTTKDPIDVDLYPTAGLDTDLAYARCYVYNINSATNNEPQEKQSTK